MSSHRTLPCCAGAMTWASCKWRLSDNWSTTLPTTNWVHWINMSIYGEWYLNSISNLHSM